MEWEGPWPITRIDGNKHVWIKKDNGKEVRYPYDSFKPHESEIGKHIYLLSST